MQVAPSGASGRGISIEEHSPKHIRIEEFVNIATAIRGTNNQCELTIMQMGGMNVAFTLLFDDGVKWIVKAPKSVSEATKNKLISEVATLKFLNKVGNLAVPQLHGFSLTEDNSAKTPYIVMDAISGITLSEALSDGYDETKMRRTLDAVANFRKALKRHPHYDIGSLVIHSDDFNDDDDISADELDDMICVGKLINLWTFDLEPHEYQSRTYGDPFDYYIDQLHISHTSGLIYGERDEKEELLLAHMFLGLILPQYVQATKTFYLAHTDLSLSNIMVDPSDGTLTGIIDWEFANTLPAQSVEHYPSFLANKERFRRRFCIESEEFAERFEGWRKYYAEQFLDDEETAKYNSRIDVIFMFERLLRDFNDRPKEEIVEVFTALKNSGALNGPLPKLPWEDSPSLEPTVTIDRTPVEEIAKRDEEILVKSKSKCRWKKALFKVRSGFSAAARFICYHSQGEANTKAGVEGEKAAGGEEQRK